MEFCLHRKSSLTSKCCTSNIDHMHVLWTHFHACITHHHYNSVLASYWGTHTLQGQRILHHCDSHQSSKLSRNNSWLSNSKAQTLTICGVDFLLKAAVRLCSYIWHSSLYDTNTHMPCKQMQHSAHWELIGTQPDMFTQKSSAGKTEHAICMRNTI